MNQNYIAEYVHTMDSITFPPEQKLAMQHALQSKLEEHNMKKRKPAGRRLILLAAAAALLLMTLTGAAVFTRWSRTAQTRYNPSEDIKEQAEKSGLSVMLEETNGAESIAEVLSVTDQGITITAVQTIVDSYSAEITFRVEGFDVPDGRYPSMWPQITLDGTTDFYTYLGGDFLMDGDILEYTHFIRFEDSAQKYFGTEIVAVFDHLALQSEEPAGYPETAVTGNWELHWIFSGTEESIHITPNAELVSSGVTLLEADIGQKTIRTTYQLNAYWSGWEILESFQPQLLGIQMQDGTLCKCIASTEGYEDMDHLIFFVESDMFDSILDLSQAESLVFRYEDTEFTIPIA